MFLIDYKIRYINLYYQRFYPLILMFIAKITVRLKKGVSDPEGANTLKALHLLGFDSIN
jgi:hypothetical protein